MMTVLILAAGEQTRWKRDNPITIPKQLVDIAGQPLLARTVNMVKREGLDPIVVTHRTDLSDLEFLPEFFSPTGRRWVTETLLWTRPLWKQRTVVLLGDVVYSPEALSKILTCREPIQFFGRKELRYRIVGRHYEIFGLTFDLANGPAIQKTLETMVRKLETKGLPQDALAGKLRSFYESWCNLPLGSFRHENVFFYPIEDWTEDLDELSDYLTFKQHAVGRGWCHACFVSR